MIPTIVAILASITSVLTSLGTIVMIMAGLANSKPAQLTQGKWMMWSIVAVQAIALAASIWLMMKHKPWPATIVGIIPFVCVVALLVVLVKIEW
jgi:cell division protein FtsW (lipid II flippase)